MKRALRGKGSALADVSELEAAHDYGNEVIKKVISQSADVLECAEAIRTAIVDSDPSERTLRE
jgi:hypothetical protein